MFTFLQPIFLFLLPLAGLPIIINFLKRRVRLRVEWPSLILLKRIEEKRARRRLRLIEVLLIIVRMLIIAFAVLLLSRPYVHAPGGSPPRDVVLIIDNSLSAVYSDGGVERYQVVLDAANRFVRGLRETDRVAVIFAGGDGPAPELTGAAGAAEALSRAPGVDAVGSFVPAYTEALAVLEGSEKAREIRFFCDGQAPHFDGFATAPRDPKVYVHDVRRGTGPYANLSVVEVSVRPARGTFLVKTVVRGWGDFGPSSLSVKTDGRVTDLKVGSAAVTPVYFNASGGAVEVSVADRGGYRFDDKYAFDLPPDATFYYQVAPGCPGASFFKTALEVLGGLPGPPGSEGVPVVRVAGPGYVPPADAAVTLIATDGRPGRVGPAEWGVEITGKSVTDGEGARAAPPLYDTASINAIPIFAYYRASYGPGWEPAFVLADGTPLVLRKRSETGEVYVLLLPVAGEGWSFARETAFVTFVGDVVGRSFEVAYPGFRRSVDLGLKDSEVSFLDAAGLAEVFPGAELAGESKGNGGWSFSLVLPTALAVLTLLAVEAVLAAYVARPAG